MVTWLGLARRIAHQEGIKPATDHFLDYVLWEHTGYPAFWQLEDGETVERCATRQLRLAFRSIQAPKQKL